MSQYQKGKTNLEFTEARDSGRQWHQLGHMQVCTSLQIDNHASTPPLSFYRLDALPAAKPTAQSTVVYLCVKKSTGYDRVLQLKILIFNKVANSARRSQT